MTTKNGKYFIHYFLLELNKLYYQHIKKLEYQYNLVFSILTWLQKSTIPSVQLVYRVEVHSKYLLNKLMDYEEMDIL